MKCLSLLLLALAAGPAISPAADKPVPPQPAGDLGVYAAVGSGVARSVGIADLGWTDAQLEAFIQGLRAAHAKQPYAFDDAARKLFAELQQRVASARPAPAAAPAPRDTLSEQLRPIRERLAMQQTDSGLLYRIIQGGAGPRPQPQDTVIANFSAKTPASPDELPQLSGRGMRMKVNELPAGVIEALQMLALGGTGLFFLPPHLSFGDGPWPEGIAPGTPIMLQIELVDIVSADAGK
jgi:FKBP-type peptidyl-prolyl cis-trans isomerase